MLLKIDHLGIAVHSIEAALRFYSAALGLEIVAIKEIREQNARVALLRLGDSRIELLEPLGQDSSIGRFLAKRNEGLHHLCIAVDDIEEELKRLKAAGVRLVDEVPRWGAGGCLTAFLHPSNASGVLLELSQPAPNPPKSTSE